MDPLVPTTKNTWTPAIGVNNCGFTECRGSTDAEAFSNSGEREGSLRQPWVVRLQQASSGSMGGGCTEMAQLLA